MNILLVIFIAVMLTQWIAVIMILSFNYAIEYDEDIMIRITKKQAISLLFIPLCRVLSVFYSSWKRME